MKRLVISIACVFLLTGCRSQDVPVSAAATDWATRAKEAVSPYDGTFTIDGVSQPVEIYRDTWGVPHVYAQTVQDLFFGQGFVAAQDRMWQLDMWKRRGEGRLAEIYGSSALGRDRFARLLKYRGDWDAEFRSYHPEGRKIVESFARGVNAAIRQAGDRLPIEFAIMGTRPEPWTPETVVLRMAGYVMTRNAASEVRRAQMVRALGPERTLELAPLNPPRTIDIPHGLNLADIDDGILKSMQTGDLEYRPVESNNWVIDGTKSITGKPLLSNDPHRDITNPSLRYIVHLVGPGWNVIGSGEPALPGVSIGHNEHIAWGFTILGIDQQDLYVEETDPQNSNRYKYRGSWLDMRVEKDQIKVKGQAPVEVELKFTRHGPVVHEDRAKNRAYVLRWIGAEPGAAGYLGALAVNQAKNWQEFKKGVEQWKLPSHNLVYADVQGNIAYHGVGLTPVRRGWDGLLPVPGSTGQYEWDGFLPMSELPNYVNPSQHFIATANHNVIPPGYKHIIGNELSSSFRYDRIVEVLRAPQKFTIADLGKLQHDATSLVARSLVPLLKGVKTDNPELRQGLDLLLSWNYWVGRDSAAAAIYEFWYMKLAPNVYRPRVPQNVWSFVQGRYSTERVIEWLQQASPERDRILLTSLEEALVDLKKLLGREMTKWRWGQLHVIDFPHPIGYNDELEAIFNLTGPARDGDGNTVFATSSPSANNVKQRGGASYRHIIDLADWDRSLGANVPGQSAQPGSRYYSNLIEIWGKNEFFPLVYSKAKVMEHSAHKLVLIPKGT